MTFTIPRWVLALLAVVCAVGAGFGVAVLFMGDDDESADAGTSTASTTTATTATDASDVTLLRDAKSRLQRYQQDVLFAAKACERSDPSYGSPQNPCYLSQVKPLVERGLDQLASDLADIQTGVGPECAAAVHRAELEAASGVGSVPNQLVSQAIRACEQEATG